MAAYDFVMVCEGAVRGQRVVAGSPAGAAAWKWGSRRLVALRGHCMPRVRQPGLRGASAAPDGAVVCLLRPGAAPLVCDGCGSEQAVWGRRLHGLASPATRLSGRLSTSFHGGDAATGRCDLAVVAKRLRQPRQASLVGRDVGVHLRKGFSGRKPRRLGDDDGALGRRLPVGASSWSPYLLRVLLQVKTMSTQWTNDGEATGIVTFLKASLGRPILAYRWKFYEWLGKAA